MDTALFEEKQVYWFRTLLFIIPPAVIVISYLSNPKDLMGMVISSAVAIAAGVTIWGFTSLEVRVTATELSFGFPLWKRKALLSQVKVGQIKKISLMAGTGLHYWNGYWVYNLHRGDGLVLVINQRKYLLGSKQPEKLQSTLWQYAGRVEE